MYLIGFRFLAPCWEVLFSIQSGNEDVRKRESSPKARIKQGLFIETIVQNIKYILVCFPLNGQGSHTLIIGVCITEEMDNFEDALFFH